jgi:glycosyltransferase involved in cell wall biosynthesis
VHNGYDSSTFFPNEDGRKGARKGLGLAPDVFAIASIARWHPQKDLPNLLAAVRLVKDRIIEFRCFLVGADLGPDNRNLTAAIERTGCSGLVVPLGPRSDIPSIARALDLHVLASCGGEAFPNVVAETMLSETPNVVTDVGDSALMVAATGWVVPPQSPQQLADAIVEAYREWKDAPGKWQERRKAARRQIADNFSIERMAEAYEEVWRKVAGVKRVSEPAP